MADDARAASEHLSDEVLAAFIDRGLSAEDRGIAEAHLAACRDCRLELAAATRLATSRDTPVAARRSSVSLWTVAAAAAVVLAVAISLGRRGGIDQSRPVERAAPAGAAVDVVAPRSTPATTRDALRFVWRDAGDAAYRVTVTDATGATLWSATTRDTAIVPPANVTLDAGRTYYWSVDALKADGSSLTSGSTPFTLRE